MKVLKRILFSMIGILYFPFSFVFIMACTLITRKDLPDNIYRDLGYLVTGQWEKIDKEKDKLDVWVEEAEELSEEDYDKLKRGDNDEKS